MKKFLFGLLAGLLLFLGIQIKRQSTPAAQAEADARNTRIRDRVDGMTEDEVDAAIERRTGGRRG